MEDCSTIKDITLRVKRGAHKDKEGRKFIVWSGASKRKGKVG
jgi:hypothetical protein